MGTLGSPPSGSVVAHSVCTGNVCEASLYACTTTKEQQLIGESYTVKGEGVLCYIPCTFLVHISDTLQAIYTHVCQGLFLLQWNTPLVFLSY